MLASSYVNTFVTLSNCLLETMQKQGHRSIISMLNKIFSKRFTVFNGFTDIAASFIRFFSLPWLRNIHVYVFLLHRLHRLYVCLFVCLFVCLLVCLLLYGYFVIIASVSSIIFSMYLHLFMFFCVVIVSYNFTIFQYFLGTDISVCNIILFIYFVLLFIHLLVHTCTIMHIFLKCVVLIICNICFCLYMYIYIYIYIYIFKYIYIYI